MKQVTGREHRDIQRYLIAIIADAVPHPFLIAIRALMDFRYMAQAPQISDDECEKIQQSLSIFHNHKNAILEAGARRGKGNKIIDNWYIPKLEFLQSVVPSIQKCGVPIQWSADVTERSHISEIKVPSRSTNNQNHEAQIVRHLDRAEKCRRFDLATSLCDPDNQRAAVQLIEQLVDGQRQDDDDDDSMAGDSINRLLGYLPSAVDYFAQAKALINGEIPLAPTPFRTFATVDAAFHLSRDPQCRQLDIKAVAETYNLPDLLPAFANYAHRIISCGQLHHPIGGRRHVLPTNLLPFAGVDVWVSVRIQTKGYHYPHEPLPPQTIIASPPSPDWPHGRCDAIAISIDPSSRWPHGGLQGKLQHRFSTLPVIWY
jgi:hypothetical protein